MSSILSDTDAIRNLLGLYCFHGDAGDGDKWSKLFTEDAVFDAGLRAQCRGRAALREFLARRSPSEREFMAKAKHFTLNTVIDLNGDEARVESYYAMVLLNGASIRIQIVGRYEDIIVKQGGQWLFKHRKAHYDLDVLPPAAER